MCLLRVYTPILTNNDRTAVINESTRSLSMYGDIICLKEDLND